jgi:hypothetical protein
MNTKEYAFTAAELEADLTSFAEKGITELTVHDPALTGRKGPLLHFLQRVAHDAPDLFVTLPVRAELLDTDICRAAAAVFCSLEIPLTGTAKSGVYLFDKKFFSRRAALLNTLGLVFGFDLDFAAADGDAVKLFRDRLDFAVSLYPNHIDFPQIEPESSYQAPMPSATFSTQDIRMTKACAFACISFYSSGRAVPWFLTVLEPLGMSASRFFQDFAEWQRCNNCDSASGWNPSSAPHADIEKMQLSFLKFKYEEKRKNQLFPVVQDMIRLNGALARCAGEDEESVIELSYHPDDLLGPESVSITAFADSVCMENITVKIFSGAEGPDYRIV